MPYNGKMAAADDPLRLLNLSIKASDISGAKRDTTAFLETNPDLIDGLSNAVKAYRDIEELIPQNETKWFSGHSFPYFESYSELENSIHHAFMGFYKSAFISIRSCLELGLLCIYYDRNDESEKIIEGWLSSRAPTPMKRKIITGLRNIVYVSALDTVIPIIDPITRLYDELSDFVHTRGYSYSSVSLNGSDINRFAPDSFKTWIEAVSIAIQDLVILFLCKYPIGLHAVPIWEKFGLNPPIGGFLESHQVWELERMIPEPVLSVLRELTKDDTTVSAILEEITSLPDLTDQQIETQAMDVEKEQIRNIGFLKWRAQKLPALSYQDEELNQYWRDRISELEEWATRNDLYEKGQTPRPNDP